MKTSKVIASFAILAGCALAGGSGEALSALKDGDNARFEAALRHGADANAKDAEGTPLLMNAVLYGDAEAVLLALEHGANPDGKNPAGATALLWAAGDPEKALVLMEHGADVNVESTLGRTPLLAAATQSGAADLVQALLASGARMDVKDKLNGMPILPTGGGGAMPLEEAAKARDGESLRLFLNAGADVNSRDNSGGSALTEAIVYGNVENAAILLTSGADFTIRVSTKRYSPLVLAAMRNNFEIARMLIDAGADVNAADASGSSVLMWAAYTAETGDPRLVDLLLEAGADPTIRNQRGESALTLSKWHGQTAAGALIEAATRE